MTPEHLFAIWIEKDLTDLGIRVKFRHELEESLTHLIIIIMFETIEDLNLYRTAGEFYHTWPSLFRFEVE